MLVYEKHLVSFDAAGEGPRTPAGAVPCSAFEPVGVYTALDVPDRVGPTWSRRSGF